MRAALALVLITLGLQTTATWRPIDLRASGQPLDASVCRWDVATIGSVFRRSANGRIEVECSQPSTAILQCDPPGFEPRDIDATTLCKSPAVSFDAAFIRVVEAAPASEVYVTWLRGNGAVLNVRAVRQFRAAGPIAVSAAPQSFIRLTPASGSPSTTVFTARDAETPLAFATDTPGGELFIRQPVVPVMPVRVTVAPQGSGTPTSCAQPACSLSGLASAFYGLTRVYDGGLSTAMVRARVEDGRSTDAWLPAEGVGGLDVTVGGGLCGSASAVIVTLGPPTNRRLASVPLLLCHARLGGIRPGPYEVSAGGERRGDLVVKQSVENRSQVWTPVTLDAPAIVVTGFVKSDEHPVKNTAIQFAQIGSNAPVEVTQTDQDGHYTIGLREAGAYAVQSLAGSDEDPWIRTTDFSVGVNQFDIEIEAGRLTIVAPRPPPGRGGRAGAPSNVLTIHVDGPRWQKSLTQTFTPTQQVVRFELAGLSFGMYGVWADASGVPTVKYETATLEKTQTHDKSSAVVDLATKPPPSYAPAPGIVDVTDAVHAPADSTLSVTTLGPTLPPVSRGHFDLTNGLAPGAPIFPSKLPSLTCAIYRRGSQTIPLPDRVAEVELRFLKLAPSLPADVYGRIAGISGATCMPYLTQFNLRRIVNDDYESIFVTLPEGSLTLEYGGQKYAVNVPGRPVIVK